MRRPAPGSRPAPRPSSTTARPSTPSGAQRRPPRPAPPPPRWRQLAVKGRAPKTGYSREQFGDGWIDTDGCDTRDRILTRDLTAKTYLDDCRVESGALADPYTAARIQFTRGGASEVDIDHVVALSDAWQKGAQRWPASTRVAFANDPLNLLAVDAHTNRSKGDGDAATWLPPNKPFRCAYVARQVAVKRKYTLAVTAAEKNAIGRVLATCPGQKLPRPGARIPVAVTHSPPRPAPPSQRQRPARARVRQLHRRRAPPASRRSGAAPPTTPPTPSSTATTTASPASPEARRRWRAR